MVSYCESYSNNGSPSSQTSRSIVQLEGKFSKVFFITVFCYTSVLLTVFMLVNEEVSKPYMDEVFHIEQVQHYCDHNFTYWNPKITTLPGLYLTSLAILKPFSELYSFGEDDPSKKCPIFMLRFVNILFACGNAFLMYAISFKIHKYTPRMSKIKILVSSISLSTFPPLFFFNFLYYTDTGSLFFLLLTYFLHLYLHPWIASIFAFISILFRQTNIVWCFLLSTYTSIKFIQLSFEKSKKKTKMMTILLSALPNIFLNMGGYVIVGLFFIAFLIYNKGIVVGDRNAHTAGIYFSQLIYLLFCTSIFSYSWIFSPSNLRRFFDYFCNHKLLGLFVNIIILLIVASPSDPHSYLLSDNRHFTFYLWRRFFDRKASFIKYALVPIYWLTGWSLLFLPQKKDNVWKFLFIFCMMISIMPQKLFEFRYFIPGYIFWRLNLITKSSISLMMEFGLNLFTDLLTIYIFLAKPFKSNEEIQRFMW